MKEKIIINKQIVEVIVVQTVIGDYISIANFAGRESKGIARANNKKEAKRTSIENLFLYASPRTTP